MHPDEIDRNGDGQPDLFIELEGDFVYELYDKNFDGNVLYFSNFGLKLLLMHYDYTSR